MPWFAAHVVTYFKFDEGDLGKIPVWENVILVRARDRESAATKAVRRSQGGLGRIGGQAAVGGHPGAIVLAGVRKVMPILAHRGRSAPSHGEEVSYLEFTADTLEEVRALAAGEEVKLVCNDAEWDRPSEQGQKPAQSVAKS